MSEAPPTTQELVAEELLREAAFRLLAESPSDVVWSVGTDGRILSVSPSVELLIGYSASEVRGMEPDELLTPESAARASEYFYRMIADLAAGRTPEPFRGDCVWRCKDGSTRVGEVLAFPSVGVDGQLLQLSGIVRDLSDRQRHEAERRHAQRMESMARMAAGIAHEVNNAIAIIRISTELFARAVPGTSEMLQRQVEVLTSVDRVSGLTARLLSFSRQQHLEPKVARVEDLLQAAHPVLERMTSPQAELALALGDSATNALLLVDPGQFEQVLLELVANARDAVGPGGRIDLRCAAIELSEPLSTRTGVLPAGAYVTFVIEDAGVGMTDAVLEHIFDPFYTTKAQDAGTGLGLPTVVGILLQHGAGIQVASAPGRGTRVTVYWPMQGSAAAPPRAGDADAVPIPVPRERRSSPVVLVVDDEPMLLTLTRRVFGRLGCEVLTAASASEALALEEERRGDIDLLLTDVRMPEMTGIELVQALLTKGVDLPVLFVSGQLDAPIPTEWPSSAPRRFLSKPFKLEQLVQELVVLGVLVEPPAL